MLKKHLIVFALFVATVMGISCSKAPGKSSAFNLPALKGANVAGADVVWETLPNLDEGSNFLWVSHQDIDYMASKNLNFVRLCFSWEALQPALNGPLNTTSNYATQMADRVNYLTNTKGIYVMIEPHGGEDSDFAAYKNVKVGSTGVPNSAFADFWSKMATLYKNNPRVLIGLTNEPHDMSTMQWFGAAQAAVTGIRNAGFTGTIMVPGNGWSGAGTWSSTSVDTATTKVSNATGWLTLKDPLNNMIASVHMYLDANSGGGSDDIVSPTIGVERLTNVVNWAKANNVKVHLSEIGANVKSTNPAAATAKAALLNVFSYIEVNKTTVVGWSWWAYGPPAWWGGYRFALSPVNVSSYGIDSAQMAFIAPFFTPPVSVPDAGTPPVVSPTMPSNPIAFTKNAVFTTNSGQTNWVYVPNGYDSTHNTPSRLFVWLHGCGGQSQFDVSMVSYMPNQDWISLAPGGRETTCWSGLSTDGPKILAAIADLKTHFNIDPKRIILGGYSSGGDIGYPLLFQNSGMFAGGIFENTGPNSAALTAAKTTPWKFNIAHLAHLSDTTYPIANARTQMTTLRNAGFPVNLIEKPGTHYDNDNGTTGTQYDLRTFLLPILPSLNESWAANTDAGVPPVVDAGVPPPPPLCTYTYSAWSTCQSTNTQTRTIVSSSPTPCTANSPTLTQACVYVPPAPVDTDGDGIVDNLDKCPTVKGIATTDGTSNGCPGLVLTAIKTSDWGTGYCKQYYFKNNNSVPMSWKTMKIHLNDGTLRGADSVWGATFSNPLATGTIVVTPLGNAKIDPGQNAQTVGFCANKGPTQYIGTNGGLTY